MRGTGSSSSLFSHQLSKLEAVRAYSHSHRHSNDHPTSADRGLLKEPFIQHLHSPSIRLTSLAVNALLTSSILAAPILQAVPALEVSADP